MIACKKCGKVVTKPFKEYCNMTCYRASASFKRYSKGV